MYLHRVRCTGLQSGLLALMGAAQNDWCIYVPYAVLTNSLLHGESQAVL